MEITTKKIDTANAQIEARMDAKIIEQKVDKLAKDIAKNMDMPGFRKGKVPVSIVKKRYSNKLAEDAKNEVVREVYEKSLKELDIPTDKLIGGFIVEKFEERDGVIEVTVGVTTKPQMNLEGYKELIPDIKTPEVTEKEVQEKINSMLKQVTPLTKVEDRDKLQNGDFALIDFEGFIDGKAFEGGKAEGYLLEIGSGSFIAGFEDGMIGMKVGETGDVKVKFPENYGSKDLAGKEAVFEVTLHEIQEKKISDDIDEKTLKQLLPYEEKPTDELLKEKVKEGLLAEKLVSLYDNEIKPKYVEALVEKYNVDLPKSIVEQEMDITLRKVLGQMKEEEIKAYAKDKEAYNKKREEFRKEASDSVKITFLVDELAKLEGIEVSDQEVIQTLYFEALQMGQNPQEMLKQYEEQGLLPAVKMAIVEDRLFKKLFDEKRESSKTE
jgi:trigger factor